MNEILRKTVMPKSNHRDKIFFIILVMDNFEFNLLFCKAFIGITHVNRNLQKLVLTS